MVTNICRLCDGHCCAPPIAISYIKSKKQLYTNNPQLKKMPMMHKKGRYFMCDNYDKNRPNGHCKDYANRPEICRYFICREAIDILGLVTEGEPLPW